MRIGIRELICILVVLAIPPVFYVSVYRPLDEKYTRIIGENETKKGKLVQLSTAVRDIDDLGAEIDRLTQAMELFEAKLPSEQEIDVILQEVSQIAMRHGLKTRSIRAEKDVAAARYTELPMKMILIGDFDGYYSFLLDLERLSRITQVPTMSVKKFDGGSDGQVEAEFTLSIFYESASAVGGNALTQAR